VRPEAAGLSLRGIGRNVRKNREGVRESVEYAQVQNGLVGQRTEPCAQGQQVAGEIPAVDRRNVTWMQRQQ
jgi:hypothetical protein